MSSRWYSFCWAVHGAACAAPCSSVAALESRVSGSPDQGVAVSGLPEGEGVGLGAGVGELDLEGALGDGSVLPDELVQPLLGKRAGAVLVHVGSVIRAGRLPVEEHPEVGWRSGHGWSHDQVEVAGLEPVGDLPAGRTEPDDLVLHRPVTSQGPVIELQLRRGGVVVRLARQDATGGREVPRARVAGVVL